MESIMLAFITTKCIPNPEMPGARAGSQTSGKILARCLWQPGRAKEISRAIMKRIIVICGTYEWVSVCVSMWIWDTKYELIVMSEERKDLIWLLYNLLSSKAERWLPKDCKKTKKQAQQRLFFLRKLKQAPFLQKLLSNCYRNTTEIILTHSLMVWRMPIIRIKRPAASFQTLPILVTLYLNFCREGNDTD